MRLLELFSGTGSVGRVFRARGWDTASLDSDPRAGADITADVLTWDYTQFPRGHFDCIWASPPCTEYSRARTTAKTPRNLELADAIVRRTQEIIAHFNCPFWVENPASGLLPGREVAEAFPPPHVVSYCMYGRPFRKNTCLWIDVPFSGKCCDKTCGAWTGQRHQASAKRVGANGVPGFSLSELHAIPESLLEAVEAATRAACVDQHTAGPVVPGGEAAHGTGGEDLETGRLE